MGLKLADVVVTEAACPYVIVNEKGDAKHGLCKKTFEEIIKHIGERTGLNTKRTIPHNLRHTFATTMIDNGAPVQYVQQLLGHARLDTTMVYVKNNRADIRRSHERCVV